MGIPVKFTPFYGAQEEGPIASLLQIDELNILLDCGWNDSFDVALLEPLTRYVYTPLTPSCCLQCALMHLPFLQTTAVTTALASDEQCMSKS
jgi:hypothetical protein